MAIWKYAIIVFLGGCSYGVVSTIVKLSYGEGFDLGAVTGGQYFIGACMLWIISIAVPKIKLTAKQLLILAASGTPMGLTGIFYNMSLEYVNASFAIILLLQFTWMSMVIVYAVDKKAPDKKNLAATAVILLGSFLASGFLKSEISFSLPGISFGLLAGFTFALFLFVSGRTTIPVHPIYKGAIMTTGATIIVFILLPPVFLIDDSISNGLLLYAIPIALFGSVFPPILFNIGMPKVGSGLGTILSASELPTAVLLSTIVLHESVAGSQWTGVLLILAGIAYPNIKRRTKFNRTLSS